MSGNHSDALVIGSGVIGSSIAYHLARQGRRVTVVERAEPGVEPSASWASAGGVRRQGRDPREAALAREAIERWRDAASEAGKPLRLDVRGTSRTWADPVDVSHVLDNLIENALRYSGPDAEVTVEVATHDGRAALAVTDTGPGIPLADRAHVFERFFRGGNGRQAGPGTGLGLAIVAELVRRWGGDVRLADAPGTRVEAGFPAATKS